MDKNNRPQLPGTLNQKASTEPPQKVPKHGDAYRNPTKALHKEAEHSHGIIVRDYVVTYSEEYAEGFYAWSNGQLTWHNPDKENAHLEIAVQDAHDGRFVPYLDVVVTLFKNGIDHPLMTTPLPFMWHPWLHHYGKNIIIPESGLYDIEVNISALSTIRHDKHNGTRYTTPVEIRFEDVTFTTGQKLN